MKTILLVVPILSLSLLANIFAALPALADTTTDKEWSVGLGVGSIYSPDYRGSKEYRQFTAPIPYVIYHGKFIRSDRDGVRTEFFASDRFEFSISGTAFITPDSSDNKKREGMLALGSTIELGPSLNIRLTGEDFQHGWYAQLPWRAVYAVGGDDNGYIGSVFQPQLVYKNTFSVWSLTYRAGLLFGSNDYHDYYYNVTAPYLTDNRAGYEAHGGFSGWNNEISLSRVININDIKTRLAFFIRYDNFNNADFKTSPLVETTQSVHGGIAFIWVIK